MIRSKKTNLWWPDFESGYDEVEDYIIRRVTDADVATGHVRTKGVCVQAGGHVGMFPRQLSKHFAFVFSFEAVPETYECLKLNTESYPNIITTNAALGPREGTLKLATRRSGRSRADADGDVEVRQTTIDALALPRCDLIYLDIEGYELPALFGAVETIEKYRPVVVVEVLKGEEEKVQRWADDNKYNRAGRVHSDWMFTP
jgi:FkbM family methyltransferase